MKVRHARICVAPELLIDLMTTGSLTICKTTSGLPRDAQLVRVDYNQDGGGMIYLVFAHPSFDEIDFGVTPPRVDVRLRDFSGIPIAALIQDVDGY